MNEFGQKNEQEPIAKDVSREFIEMSVMDFNAFLRSQRQEPFLSIAIDWDDNNPKLDEHTLIRLKAFLETRNYQIDQKRYTTVRATEEQKNGPVLSKSHCRNAFSSGVKWEKVEK